jgi:hypothetical protein
MTAVLRTTAAAIFTNHQEAARAVDELRRAGFPDENIGFVGRNQVRNEPAKDTGETGSHLGEGAAVGVFTGGAIGTVAGLVVAAGLIPAIGPVIFGGVLTAILASAATGVAAGGVIGALIGLGIPEEEAGYYEKELQAGRTLVTVDAGARYDEAVAILRRHGALGKGSPLV